MIIQLNSSGVHAKRYVEEVFAESLEKEGFICPDNNSLCWYRIKNDAILNSIVFFSSWNKLPLAMSIGYAMHPLFVRPVHTTSIKFSNIPTDSERFREQPLVGNGALSYQQYSQDIKVMVPRNSGNGLYTFENVILPKMEQATSIEACYQVHKDIRLNYKYNDMFIKFKTISDVFVDEAIYVEDTEVYPYCIQSIERHIQLYQERCAAEPNVRSHQDSLKVWEQRNAAIQNGAREEYIQILKEREEANRCFLKQKYGIL